MARALARTICRLARKIPRDSDSVAEQDEFELPVLVSGSSGRQLSVMVSEQLDEATGMPLSSSLLTTAHQGVVEPNNQLSSGCSRIGTTSSYLANLEREKVSKPSRTVPFLKPQCAASTFR